MARHAQTNCFLLFTYNQSLPQFGTSGKQQNRVERWRNWDEPQRSRLAPSFMLKSFSVLEKQNQPSLYSTSPLPILLSSPSQQTSWIICPHGLHVLLSLSLLVHHHPHSPPNNPAQMHAPWFSVPRPVLIDTTIRPVVRIRNPNFNPLPPSPSAVYPGHSKSFDFTTKSLKKKF